MIYLILLKEGFLVLEKNIVPRVQPMFHNLPLKNVISATVQISPLPVHK